MPLLRSIPYLGALFRWNRDTQTKSNLMVFLRPTIVRSNEDLAEVSRQRYDALRDLSKPGSRKNNSLLLPRDARQLFESSPQAPSADPRPQRSGDL
ncbi:Type II secretion system protein D precursor [compost metagenome]